MFIFFRLIELTFCLFFKKTQNTLKNYITVKRNVSSDSTSLTVMVPYCPMKHMWSSQIVIWRQYILLIFFFSKEVIAGTLLEFSKCVTEIYLSLPRQSKCTLLLWLVPMWLLFEKKNTPHTTTKTHHTQTVLEDSQMKLYTSMKYLILSLFSLIHTEIITFQSTTLQLQAWHTAIR